MGLQWMVYTDIARDGVLAGPNFDQLQTMLNTVKKINLIASGGIATIEDVRKLAVDERCCRGHYRKGDLRRQIGF